MRLNAIVDNTELTKHVPLIQYLGAQAMSSDQSEDERKRTISYPRVYPRWRSPQLAALLWQADTASKLNRATPLGPRKKPGTQLRICPHTHKYNETAPAPVGLSRNCYEPDWLSKLTEKSKKELKAQDKDYEFVTVESGASHSTTDASQAMEIVANNEASNNANQQEVQVANHTDEYD